MSFRCVRASASVGRAKRQSRRAGSLTLFTLILVLLASFAGAGAEEPKASPVTPPAVTPPAVTPPVAAGPSAPPPGEAPAIKIPIVYLGKAYDEPIPLSLVDKVLTDKGIEGARLAIRDNNKTGLFLGQEFDLVEAIVAAKGDVVAKA